MITCTKTEEGYRLDGLSAADLEVIQDGITRLFNETDRKEHRAFRTQVLGINRPIDAELDKLEVKKQFILNI